MSDDYTGPVIEFSLSPWWAANAAKHTFFKAPDNWAEMNEKERAETVQEALDNYLNENLESNWTVYDSPEAAVEQTSERRFSGHFYASELEDW